MEDLGTTEAKEVPQNDMPGEAFNLFKFRVQGITDRDAPSLYNPAKDRSLYALWTDKTEYADNSIELSEREYAMKINALQRLAVELSPNENSPLTFIGCFGQNLALPFMRAEVDALSTELKMMFRVVVQDSKDHFKASIKDLPIRETSSSPGKIADRYWIEMQHVLAVMDTEEMTFVSTLDGTQTVLVKVPRDPVFISNHIAECILFMDCVKRGELPPSLQPTKDLRSS